MAIETTKHGKLPEVERYAFECHICKTESLAQARDGNIVYDVRDGFYLKVQCPLCRQLCFSSKVKE